MSDTTYGGETGSTEPKASQENDSGLGERYPDASTKKRGRPKGLTPISDEQKRAANMLASGLSNAEVSQILDITPQTVRNWSKREDFKALVVQKAATLPARKLGRAFEERFGVNTVEQARDLLVSSLMCVVLSDPADFYDEDGNMRPMGEVPYESRLALQELGNGKKPPKFVDKLGAIKQLMVSLGLHDIRSVNLDKMKDLAVDDTFFRGLAKGDDTREKLIAPAAGLPEQKGPSGEEE